MKKIILTESDIQKIVLESVNAIIKESAIDDIKQKLRDARARRDKAEVIRLGRMLNDFKLKQNPDSLIVQPSVYWSSEENAKRGITEPNGTAAWRVKGNMTMKKALDKEDRERDKMQINDVDNILGQ